MVKFTSLLVASVAVFASAISAHEGHDHPVVANECAANVSASVIAVVENVTFFDTCATSTTFKLTSLMDANNLSTTDFFTFCSSSACLGPLHTVMHDAPLTCLITYKGLAQNLTGEITVLHDKCHAIKDAAKVPTPAPATTVPTPATTVPTLAATVTTPAPSANSNHC